jgi:hypothetical protein
MAPSGWFSVLAFRVDLCPICCVLRAETRRRTAPSSSKLSRLRRRNRFWAVFFPRPLPQRPVSRPAGFRHKKTKIEYHHAAAQTDRERKAPTQTATKYHRDCQTTKEVTRSQQVIYFARNLAS